MQYTVGDLVAEFLSACGVRTAFGIVSVHNIPLLDAIGRRNAIRFVGVRGEMGGGHMADAYARAAGGLGVLITSTGPAAANAVPALVEAKFAGSPLLHITGQTAVEYLDRDMGTVHDVPGQTAMLVAAGKASYRIRTAREAFGVLLAAAADALSAPTGPVTVEIPIDVQRAAIERPAALDRLRLPIRPPLPPSEAELDAVAERLLRARRPMLWLGNGARHAGPEALRLLELGFGSVSSLNGRGIVPEDHVRTFGALSGIGAPEIEAFYETVDAMVVVGSRLRGHETSDFRLKLPKTLIQVDVDARAFGRTYPSALFVCGDAALTLDGLRKRLAGRMAIDPRFGDDLVGTRRKAVASYRESLGPYADFPAQLQKVLPRDAVWVRDATVAASTWGHRLISVHAPGNAIHPVGAAIGPGLPFGIGAALAVAGTGRKAVAMVGDGGFALNMTELWTAVQEQAELCIIVMNDGGYAAIGHIQDALAGGRRFYAALKGPDLLRLADLAGLPAWRVERADAFGDIVGRAIATPGPTLVEVDMNAIGPAPAYAGLKAHAPNT